MTDSVPQSSRVPMARGITTAGVWLVCVLPAIAQDATDAHPKAGSGRDAPRVEGAAREEARIEAGAEGPASAGARPAGSDTAGSERGEPDAGAAARWWSDAPVTRLADDLDVRPLTPPDAEGRSAVWWHRSSRPYEGRPLWANGIVVFEEDSAMICDTPWTAEQTERLVAWMEHTIGVGPTVAMVSHAHVDAAGGVAVLQARGVPVHGSERTVAFAAESDTAPPDVPFAREARVTLGGAAIELFYPGHGHAPGNAVAIVPAHRVVFGGCFVKSRRARGMGFVGDADLDVWPAALDAVVPRCPPGAVLVPGHGEPDDARFLLGHTRGMVVTYAEGLRSGG